MKENPFSRQNVSNSDLTFELFEDSSELYLLNNGKKYLLDQGLIRLKALELILKERSFCTDIDYIQADYREVTGENLPVYRVELLEFDEKMVEK